MSSTHVVTGANRGLGLEFTRQLVERGENVIATARQPDAAPQLQALGTRVEPLDVGDASSVARFIERVGDTPIDVLVNNAGTYGGRPALADVDWEDVERTFRINAVGPLRLTQGLLANLRAGRRKLIASVTSRMGSIDDNTSGGSYAYRASKAALNMLNKSLSLDLRRDGFTCIVLHPGWVRTAMGGDGAPVTVEESVAGMLRVMDRVRERDTGSFFDYKGEPIPW